MKSGTLVCISAVSGILLAGSLAAQVAVAQTSIAGLQSRKHESIFSRLEPLAKLSSHSLLFSSADSGQGHYPWKTDIVTTVFWVGESPSSHNPVPNDSSSWDANWAKSYGGFDDPDRADRQNYMPVNFTPRQNPFYCALPYNDKAREGHRPEAPKVIPWFKEAYKGPAVSVCKDRWVAIRKGNRTVYAQWEDAGPFCTDHWEYVFGNERPKPNLNHGAGLDVSPAVRDYLGLAPTDVTDWKFVDFSEVPPGPWARVGNNNTFVLNARKAEIQTASAKKKSSAVFR